MRHPQLQARKPLAQPPSVPEVFERVLEERLARANTHVSARIGVVIDGDEVHEYVVDFACGMLRGGHEWRAASEDPDLDVLVHVEEKAFLSAMTEGAPPPLRVVRGDAAALAPLIALLRSSSG